MHIVCLCLVAMILAAADNLTPDALSGTWAVDQKALTKEQKEAAASTEQETKGEHTRQQTQPGATLPRLPTT